MSADRQIAYPRTFNVTHKQSITNWMIPQDIPHVKKYFLYIVLNWNLSEQNHKICLYVYNTALIRVSGCISILVRIIAVLFPFCRIKAILMRIIYGFYAYKAKRILVIRIKWYRNAELIRIYGSRFSLAACSISRVN